MRQEQSIIESGETAPSDFVDRIPKLSVDDDLSLADVRNGLVQNQDIKQQLLNSGLNEDEIRDVHWALRRVYADLSHPALFEGSYARMDVSELRETLDILDDEDWLQALSSERDLKILRKLF